MQPELLPKYGFADNQLTAAAFTPCCYSYCCC